MIYTLKIEQKKIVCMDGRAKGARLIAHGAGMEFYIVGAVTNRIDQVMNVIANKAIEVIGTAKNIHAVRGEKAAQVIHPKQLKLL